MSARFFLCEFSMRGKSEFFWEDSPFMVVSGDITYITMGKNLAEINKPRLKPNSSVFGLTEYYSANS